MMFERPESSLTSTRRSLPTRFGVDVLVAAGGAVDGVDVHAALVGERARCRRTAGSLRKCMLAISYT